MARFGKPSVSQLIQKVAANDPSTTEVDFSGNSIYQMKSSEKTRELCDALVGSKHVTRVILQNCEIGNGEAAMIGEMLAKNQSIEELILKENKPLKDEGAIAIAKGLAGNTTLLQMDLMGMPKLGMSERVLTAFIDMYATNFHLKKITWRLDHRLANTLARLVTRNNSIHRRIDQGKTFDDLLPDALRGTGVVVKGVASTAGADGKPAFVPKAALVPAAEPAPAPAPAPKKKGGGDGAAVEDSNMALVGSDADKDARKKAAEGEAAWKGCGAKVGLEIWRIEKFQVVPWPKEEYGSFYDGDSYIVLSTTLDPESAKLGGEKLLWDIHFWLGESTSLDEQGTAAYKTVELDDLMGGAPVQHRECMNYESEEFAGLFEAFGGVRYLEGGVDSGFNKVEADAYIAKLLHVRKTKKHGMKIVQVPCALASLNHGDCFILDAGASIYVWCGDECSAFEKRAATTEAENIENSRNGRANATHDITDDFWALLGGGPDGVAPAHAATDDIGPGDVGEGVMYKLSDEGGELMCNEVMRGDLKLEHLDTNEVMLVDTASGELFVWIGKGASDKESRNALKTATSLLESIGKPKHTPIHLYKEGAKITNPIWVSVFS